MGLAECPECGYKFEVNELEVGEIIECEDCGVELEVRSTSPLTLDLAPQEEEDWGE